MSFDPTQVVGFGTHGQQAAVFLTEVVRRLPDSCRLTYDQNTKVYTILGSQNVSLSNLKEGLLSQNFRGWMPSIKKYSDNEGNIRLELIALASFPKSRGYSEERLSEETYYQRAKIEIAAKMPTEIRMKNS